MRRSRLVLCLAALGSTLLMAQRPLSEERFVAPDGSPFRVESNFDPHAARVNYEREYLKSQDDRTQSEWAPIHLKTKSGKELGTSIDFFSEVTHRGFTQLGASYWGLSASRIATMQAAADQPDFNQSGLSNYYNQQWSHAFILASGNTWIWGDADDDFNDNLDGYGGEIEGHEGFEAFSAKEAYARGDQRQGDWYVGYATHYIADVSLVVHASAPSITRMDLLTKHFAFEDWVKNNATSGHRLMAAVAADPYYYTVVNPKASIRNAAYFACYWSKEVGRRVWDAYVASGYPTAAGSGNAALVQATKEMMIRAVRYVRGTIKYALDKNGQWAEAY